MDITQTIQQEAETLINKMIENPEISVENEENVYYVTVRTDEAATIIGRHGETIRSIQKILEVILYKETQQSVQILVNVNDFRERQQEQLEEHARNAADEALESGSPTHIRGLSSYERKIVHQFITENYPQLSTFSVGEGRDRHLVVDTKDNASTQETA